MRRPAGRDAVRGLAAAAVAAGAAAAVGAPAAAAPYAPLDRPGPALTVPEHRLRAAMRCSADLAAAGRAPILLLPGTYLTPETNFGWNWERALQERGWPYCTVSYPGRGAGDVQTANEYVTYAIRRIHATAGRRIAAVGYSQGGTHPRWTMRFWPDTRAMLEEYVSLDTPHEGSRVGDVLCATGVCSAAGWQYGYRSAFSRALNSGRWTFPGVDYTSISTRTSEAVQPSDGDAASASLPPGGPAVRNVAVQDVCPGRIVQHALIGSVDPTAFAITVDALSHPGPADPARVSRSVCADVLMPGIDPSTFATDVAAMAAQIASTTLAATRAPGEPPLRCYVTATCPSPPAPAGDERPPVLRMTLRAARLPLLPRVAVRADEAAAITLTARVRWAGRERVVARRTFPLRPGVTAATWRPRASVAVRRRLRVTPRAVVTVTATASDASSNRAAPVRARRSVRR